MKLYPDQQHGKELIIDSIRRGNKRIMFAAPVAYGKTVLMCDLANGAMQKNNITWLIVDSTELVDQTRETLKKFDINAAVIQGQHEDTDYTNRVQVVMAQTLKNRWHIIDANPQWKPQMAIVDEGHIQHQAVKELMAMMPNLVIIAFSATPTSKGLKKLYQDLIVPTTIAELIEQKRLVKIRHFTCYNPDMNDISTNSKGDYLESDLEKKFNVKEIRGDVVKNWLRLGENRKTIVFAINIQHSIDLANEFADAGVATAQIDGYTHKDMRKQYIEDFKNGTTKVLCSVAALVKGFNVVDIGCVCSCRSSKSLAYWIQSVGRGTRKNDIYDDLFVLDFGGNTKRLGYVDDYNPLDHGLCDGEKGNKNDRQQKEVKTKTCPGCKQELKAAASECSCGHEFTFKEKIAGIVVEKGDLKELRKTLTATQIKHIKNTTPAAQQRFYSGLIGYRDYKGYKHGYAYKAFLKRFGLPPDGLEEIPGNFNSGEIASWITAQNIRAGYANKTRWR